MLLLRQQALTHDGRRRFVRAQAEMKDWTQRKELPQGCCPGQQHACVCVYVAGWRGTWQFSPCPSSSLLPGSRAWTAGGARGVERSHLSGLTLPSATSGTWAPPHTLTMPFVPPPDHPSHSERLEPLASQVTERGRVGNGDPEVWLLSRPRQVAASSLDLRVLTSPLPLSPHSMVPRTKWKDG